MNKIYLYYIYNKYVSCELTIIIVNTHISLIINIVSTFEFFKDEIIIRVSQTYRVSLYIPLFLVSVAYTLRYYFTSVNSITYIHWCTIFHFGEMMLFCCCDYYQYHFVLYCINSVYFALTTSLPAIIIFPWKIVFSYSVQSSKNLITQWPIVVISVLLMVPY